MRSLVFLGLGLVIGAIGAGLFVRSLPPPEGSKEEQMVLLQREIERRDLRIQELESMEFYAKERLRREADRSKHSILKDIRMGRTVELNDLFNAAKPFLSEFAPFFQRIRHVELRRSIEATVAELGKEYQLTSAQQKALEQGLLERVAEHGQRWEAVVSDPTSTIADFANVEKGLRLIDAVDELMAQQLSGDALARYQRHRLEVKAAQVQREAEARVEQLDQIVSLSEAQKDQVFSLMARSSRDFDPAMQLDGVGQDVTAIPPGQSRDEAILKVLTPEQRQQYEVERQQRRERTEAELREIGLRLPDDWDLFNND